MSWLVIFSAIAIGDALAQTSRSNLSAPPGGVSLSLIHTLFFIEYIIFHLLHSAFNTRVATVFENPRPACDVCDSIVSDTARRWRQIATALKMTRTLRQTRSLSKISQNREIPFTSVAEVARGVFSHDSH
jgi:hypothetical protein